ncbi:MAG: hydrogenase maturation protease [Candidatus Bathycorpusculaceae bacterium]
MASGKYNLQKELRKWLVGAKRVVVTGIGNPIRMDDFVGVKIVHELQGKVSSNVQLIECETVPESFMQQIIDFNPTHVLLIDAAILGLKPGESRLTSPKQLEIFPAFTTHMLPLRVFCEHITQTVKAKVALLLIEPKQTDFGEGLTKEVENAEQKIVENLLEVLP